LKFGLHIPDFTWECGVDTLRGDLADVARVAEQAGFDRISVMDHLWKIGPVGPVEHAMLEAYTTLGYLAAKTERVQLLTVVTAVVYRQPGLLAKAVSTLDVLSGGRAMLGIGAAWNEEESRGLGLFFPRRRSGSRGWSRRCRSASRCGVMTTGRTRGNMTNWAAHSTLRSHSPRGARLCRHRKDGAAALRCRRER